MKRTALALEYKFLPECASPSAARSSGAEPPECIVAHRGTQQRYACRTKCKYSLRSAEEVVALQQELACMRGLAGEPNIVEFIDAYEEPECLHVITELCEGGTLEDLLAAREGGSGGAARAPEEEEAEAAAIFRQVASAVHSCHARGVLHRAVHPRNILLKHPPDGDTTSSEDRDRSQGGSVPPEQGAVRHGGAAAGKGGPAGGRGPVVKLGGFGSAVRACGRVLSATPGGGGDAAYRSPELISRRLSGCPQDMWSLGVCLHRLLSGEMPYAGAVAGEVYASICERGPPQLEGARWRAVSPAARHLVRALLQPDPLCRATAAHVLASPWLSGDSGPGPLRAQAAKATAPAAPKGPPGPLAMVPCSPRTVLEAPFCSPSSSPMGPSGAASPPLPSTPCSSGERSQPHHHRGQEPPHPSTALAVLHRYHSLGEGDLLPRRRLERRSSVVARVQGGLRRVSRMCSLRPAAAKGPKGGKAGAARDVSCAAHVAA